MVHRMFAHASKVLVFSHLPMAPPSGVLSHPCAEPAFPAAVHVGWILDRGSSRCREVCVAVTGGVGVGISSCRT